MACREQTQDETSNARIAGPPEATHVGDSADFERLPHAPSAWRTLNSVQCRAMLASSVNASACTTPEAPHDTCQIPFSVPEPPARSVADPAERADAAAAAPSLHTESSPPLQPLPSAAAMLAARHVDATSASCSWRTGALCGLHGQRGL